MATIDNLSLNITAQTAEATRKIKALSDALKSLKGGAGLTSTANGLKSLKEAISSLNQIKLNPDKYKGFAKEIKTVNDAISKVSLANVQRIERLANAMEKFGNVRSVSKSARSAMSEALSIKPTVPKESEVDVKESAEAMGESAENAEKLKKEIDGAKESASDFKKRADSIAESLRNISATPFRLLGKAISVMGNAFKRLTEPFRNFVRSLGRIALYRVLRSIIKEITAGVKEGIENLARFSKLMNEMDTHKANRVMSLYASNFLYLKNTIATAVIPILKALEPVVDMVINRIVDLTNVIAQLFSAITGSTTYTRAKYYFVDYADSLDKASGSAKKLNKQLAQFDELNNLTTSGGSGSGTDLDYLKMFEDPVPIADWIQKLKEHIQNGDWKSVGKEIANRISEGLGSINWTANFAKSFLAGRNLADFLNGIIDPNAFYTVGETIAGAIMTGINFALGFSKRFDWDNLGVSIGEGINGFFENFDANKTVEAISTIAHGLEKAFRKAVQTINWQEVFHDLGTLIGGVVIDNLDLILKAVAIITVAKFAVSFTQGALDELSRQIGAIIASKVGIKLTGLSVTQIGSGVGSGLISKLFGKAVGAGAGAKAGGAVLSGSSQYAGALSGGASTAGTASFASVASSIGSVILTAIGAYMLTNGIGEVIAMISPNGNFLGLTDDEWAEANPLYKIFSKEKFENAFFTAFDAIHLDDAIQNVFQPMADWWYGEDGFWNNLADGANKAGQDIYGTNGFWSKVKSEAEKVGKSIYGSNGFWASLYNKSVEISQKINGADGIWNKMKVAVDELGIAIYGAGGFWEKVKNESTKVGQSIYGSNGFWAKVKNKADEIGQSIYGSNGFWSKFGLSADQIWTKIKSGWDSLKARIMNDPINASIIITQTVKTVTSGVQSVISAGNQIYENASAQIIGSSNGGSGSVKNPTVSSIPDKLKLPTKPSGMPTSSWNAYLENWKKQNPARSYYAKGGFPDMGSMFIAGEAGAELVGNINGRTGVANTDQIEDAIYTASYDAMSKALSENNMSVIVEGDADGMFRVFQRKATDFFNRTGRPAI